MTPRFSQWLPGEEIPEKHWMYRISKKYWFYDFNAYKNVAHDAEAKARELKSKLDPLPAAANTSGASRELVNK
jgi:hypothetical protein